jgi:DNA-binding GntR family transcriptional regulator
MVYYWFQPSRIHAKMPPSRVAVGREAAPAPPVDEALAGALEGFRLDPGRSYTVQVHETLQRAIVRGSLPPRTALSEAAISSLIEVSRTPVREALALLADEQLVQIYRQVGTIVAPVRTALIEEGRFVRSTLECANHVQLALSITGYQLAEFGTIVARQRAAVAAGQTDQFSELDELMHRRLFEFAGRSNVWDMLEPIKRQFDRVRWLLLGRVADHASRTLQEHERILAQMAARDVAGLGASVAEHINHITGHLAALRRQAPESYFTD